MRSLKVYQPAIAYFQYQAKYQVEGDLLSYNLPQYMRYD